ncbi:hypothetical protein M378DRAFT_171853 [Amanita muscaria Koide BX008]|uniref:Uncharacterized protein n=1 Tax=Amanita muscaria (strain Koide BX008) TaxID=946122 RepID=A0A0C2W852_AMAMK|nr:hypothetical protein M378DRAFT_171853 [Amanita muscaria Koide BX008]
MAAAEIRASSVSCTCNHVQRTTLVQLLVYVRRTQDANKKVIINRGFIVRYIACE